MITVFNKFTVTVLLMLSTNAFAAVVDDFETGSGLDIVTIEGGLKAMIWTIMFVFGGWVIVSKLRSFSEDKTSGSELASVIARTMFFSLVVILIIV